MKATYIIWQIIKMVLHIALTVYVTENLLEFLTKPIPTVGYMLGMFIVVLLGATLVVNLVLLFNKIKNQLN